MVTSETEIGNLALAALGGGQIVDINDSGDPAARAVKLHYGQTRDTLLRRHPWNFAKRQGQLNRLAESPAFKWAAQYAMPVDLIRFWKVGEWTVIGEGPDARYEIQGATDIMPNLLMTTDHGPLLSVEYVYRVEDVTKFDSLFIDAFSYLLAHKIAPAVTGNMSLASQMLSQYEQLALPAAQTADDHELRRNADSPLMQQIRQSGMYRSRFGGYGFPR